MSPWILPPPLLSPFFQAKLRLEMEMERLRQTHAKEVESRDEEVEEIRQSCQKKVGLGHGPAAQRGGWDASRAPAGCRGGAGDTITQRPAPTRPLPGSSRLGRSNRSRSHAGHLAAHCANGCSPCPARGVTPCPRGTWHTFRGLSPSLSPLTGLPGLSAAEADGGAAGGGVRGQAEGAEREAGAGEQIIGRQRPGRAWGHPGAVGGSPQHGAWYGFFPLQANQRDFETEKRLRRDLKRTKALLADAQIMLDHLKNNAPSKREIAQLKNQVGPGWPPLQNVPRGAGGVPVPPGQVLSRVPAARGVRVHLRGRRQGPQVHGGGD